jgi:two-component system, sensor histidine kinase RegB
VSDSACAPPSNGAARTNTPRERLAKLFAPVGEPAIVLKWLVLLRWLALAGQIIATLITVYVLRAPLPLRAMGTIFLITGLSNLTLEAWTRQRTAPQWVIPAVLLLDVCLLTALLLCSGGASNPFSCLFLVHVAMAVVTLAEGGAWLIVAAATAGYGLLLIWPASWSHPLPLSPDVAACADWIALVLMSIVIAYFVGRVTRSLQRHEKALESARERAARNERLASLTTLAAGAAHELNTPLSTIAVVARELELQAKNLELADAFSTDARLIRQEVDRCQFILGRMRVDVLQTEAPRREAMSPTDFVETLRRDLKPPPGRELRLAAAGDVRSPAAPFRVVEQALVILVDNAMEASPDGGAVELSIFNRNGSVVFQVKDEGQGMPPDVVRRAGEPFFTTKPPGKGMGLGLFLARLIAEKLGGSLKLDSTPGSGTCATLELPG